MRRLPIECVINIAINGRSWWTLYTLFHPLVVEVSCALFLTQPACIAQNQNTQNFYYKRMKDGVEAPACDSALWRRVHAT